MTPRQALAKARRRRIQQHLVNVWAQVKAHPSHESCNCGLRKGMTVAQLRNKGAGCTAPRYVCPVLDKYRRLMGV